MVFLSKRLVSAYSRGSSSRAFHLVPRRGGGDREWEVDAAAGGAVTAVGAVLVWDDYTGGNTGRAGEPPALHAVVYRRPTQASIQRYNRGRVFNGARVGR